MKNRISWTERQEDGVKRETRVEVSGRGLKWQFKRTDEERWDYESQPQEADWDTLEDILRRRAGRGRAVKQLLMVQKIRESAGSLK
jgi:hypothetical protein